jgi:hypothetical protein
MLEIRNQEWSHVMDAHSDVTLVGATSKASATWPRFAAGAVYHRPTRVEFGGIAVPVVDHLMMTRIVVAVLFAIAMIWRSIRG